MSRSPIALVTGARRGIGRGIAYALCDAGFDLVLNDAVEDDDATATLSRIVSQGGNVNFLPGDIGDIDSHLGLVAAAFDAFGTIDCLVNNAGITVKVRGDLLDVAPESFDRVLDINLRGTFFLTQAVARRMLAAAPREDDAPPRSIITISSVNARLVGPDRAEYCIAKTGLAMMNQLFAERLAGDDIACFEIRPGMIHTAMTVVATARYDAQIDQGRVPMRRWGEPDDVGKTVAALAQRLLPFNTGDAFHVDGGMHMRVL